MDRDLEKGDKVKLPCSPLPHLLEHQLWEGSGLCQLPGEGTETATFGFFLFHPTYLP